LERPAQARPENRNAERHGAYSEAKIVPRASAVKRRLLRRSGLRVRDLDPLGRALLTNWARAAAALSLMDEYAAEHGWLNAHGKPLACARFYASMLNSERLAIAKLSDYLRAAQPEPGAALADWIDANAYEDDAAPT
jgi:hypothetical protein